MPTLRTAQKSLLTERELELIGHSLGVNVYHARKSKLKRDKKLPAEFYRNYFCFGSEKNDDYPVFESLEKEGIAQRWHRDDQVFFGVTTIGIDLFKLEFKRQIN